VTVRHTANVARIVIQTDLMLLGVHMEPWFHMPPTTAVHFTGGQRSIGTQIGRTARSEHALSAAVSGWFRSC
jgi:hypothetical protein